MISIISSFSALFLAAFCFLMGTGMLSTVLSLRMNLEGFSTHITGLIMAFYYMGLLAGFFICHYVIERVGHIRALTAFVAVATICVMVYGLYLSATTWALLRFLSGIASFGLFMVIESWLSELTDSSQRGRVFSIYMVMTYLGSGFGQQMIKLGEVQGEDLFLIVGILLSLSMIPIAVTKAAHPALPKRERYRFGLLLHKSPLGVLGCLSAGLINSAFLAMTPVFASQIGLNVAQISWLMSVGVLGGLSLQWVVGTLSDHYDRTLIILLLGISVAALTLFLYFSETRSFPWLMVEMGSLGGLAFTIYPTAVARAQDVFEGKNAVAVSAGLLLAYSIGASLGPIAASAMMGVMRNPYGLFAYWAVISSLFTGSVFYFRHAERIKFVRTDEQVAFFPMRDTSPVATQFDPRNETADMPESTG